MSVFEETMIDIKKLKKAAEESAKNRIIEQAAPRIDKFIQEKLFNLNEQQLNALGPEGFPYEEENIKVPGSSASDSYGQPVVAATASDMGRNPQVPVNSVAVPQMGAAGMSAVPSSSQDGVGVLIDLDAVASEVKRLMSEPEVPTQTEPLGSPQKPISVDVNVDFSKEQQPAQEDSEIDDSDLVSFVEKDDEILGDQTKETEEEPVEDSEEESKNTILIDPSLTRESNDDVVDLDVIVEALSIREERREGINISSNASPSDMLRFDSEIQETLKDAKTLKRAIRGGLNSGSITKESFANLYNAASLLESNVKSELNRLNSLQLVVEMEDPAEVQSDADDAQLDAEEAESTPTSEMDEGDCDKMYEISDVLNHFGGGTIAKKRVIEDSGQVGPMKSDETVYEVELSEGLAQSTAKNMEESKMKKFADDELIEISEADLRKALAQARIDEQADGKDVHHRADGGAVQDPAVPSLTHEDPMSILEPSDVDEGDEVEASDLAGTSTVSRSEKMPKGVSEAVKALKLQVRDLRTQLSETAEKLDKARLTNAKLIHANKLMQKGGLAMEDKRRIAKAIDGAESVREVKLVFNAIMEQIGSSAATLKEGRVRPGASSRVTKSGSSSQKSLNEGSQEFSRFKKLAGMN
jgi:hypothetical protein